MAIPLPGSAVQAQQINQRIQNIENFSQLEDGLQCFMDPANLEVMDHNPQVLPCGHTFEASTIRNVQQQAAQAVRNHLGGYLPTVPRCPSCRHQIPVGYVPPPNINLKQAIETIGDRVLPTLQHEQMQKTVYRDALAQDVQQLAGEIVQRNARITTLEGENGVLQAENGQLRTERDVARTERDAVQEENITLTEQKNRLDMELSETHINNLNADIQKASTSISRKGRASFVTAVGSCVGMLPTAVAGGIIGGPVGFFAGFGAGFAGLGVADKIDESTRRTKEEKLQKEQEKLALEVHIRNLRAQQRV